MPRILCRSSIFTTPLLVLSLLLILMSLPGGQDSPWNSLRPTAGATTFYTVNSIGDGADSNLADGVCNDGTGACTLRAAIQEANTVAGDDTITFDISLNFHVITLNTALPDISSNLNFSGNGPGLLTVQRNAAAGTPDFRIFTINSGTTVTITGLTISNGHVAGTVSPANLGGGILNSGNLTLNFCAVSGNFAGTGGGGGIQNFNTITISNSAVSGNTGGGLANSLFGANTSATINQSVISGNTLGSGIYNNGANGTANLTINNSTISENTTESVAGGGGILNGAGSFTSRATLTINNSTISGNTAAAGAGGGIYNAAVFGNALTTLKITNSTITGNSSSGDGGGIQHFSNGSGSTAIATITNSTIVENTAGSGHGGGVSSSMTFGSITTCSFRNTIVANNPGSAGVSAPDLSGEFDSQDYNLLRNVSAATITGTTTHNITGLDPQLSPLANYGGQTKTMIPLPSSPVIDIGDAANLPADTTDVDGDGNTTEVLPIDQRGLPRVVNVRFEMGAVETNYSITATAGSGQSAAINTAFATQLTATVAESGNIRSGISVTFTKPSTLGPSGAFSRFPIFATDVNGVAAMGFSANEKAGAYNVLASFSNTFNPLPIATFSLTNLKGPTTTTVTSSPNPSTFGQIVTFTATVSGGPGNVPGIPGGQVQFKVDGVTVGGPVPLDELGGGSLSTNSLAVGTHAITADYSGDANYLASTGTVPSPQMVNLELAIDDATITEGDSGTRTANFTVTLTAGSNVQVKVDFATADVTASSGSDYQSTSGTLTFNPGQTTQPISVVINGDVSFESNETFLVNLSNPVNAIINDAQGLGTIFNDDAQGGFISFSQSLYTVGESAAFTTITVNRSNDLSGAATVDYFTRDYTDSATLAPCNTVSDFASSRCDYTSAFGTLRFEPGQTSKTLIVLISQDSFVETPESLSLTLTNLTGGAAFGSLSTATLTIADDATEPATNPIDSADAFVRQHYHDFLNREPDSAGLAFWTNQITECQQPGATCSAEVRRINVSAAFFLSIEFQETGYLAYRFYKSAYGNLSGTPVPLRFVSEFLPDTQQIGKGVVIGQPGADQLLEANKVAYALDFVSRSRFTSAYPTTLTPAQFVDALFVNAGVTPSATDRNAAINEFAGAGNTADTAARARALRRVAENSIFRQQESNRAFVLMQYFGYMRRNPNDPPEAGLNFDGYNFWLGKLNEFNGNFVNAEMVKAFIISGEYRHRFGP